MMLFCITCT